MNKALLVAILATTITSIAQANVYCPQGPADCIESSQTHKITCNLVGNDGSWRIGKGFFPFTLPSYDKHYYFPFAIALSGVAHGPAVCGYMDSTGFNGPSFFTTTPLVPSQPGLNGWQPSPIGSGFDCGPIAGVCPFKPAS